MVRLKASLASLTGSSTISRSQPSPVIPPPTPALLKAPASSPRHVQAQKATAAASPVNSIPGYRRWYRGLRTRLRTRRLNL